MATIINTTFRLKRGTEERWKELNPILDAGEPGFEIDTGKLKIGNGNEQWTDLRYIGEGSVSNLTPVDGSLIIQDGTIDIGISAEPGNALVKKSDGLYVGTSTSGNYAAGLGLTLVDGTFAIKLAEDTHGLIAVDGALSLDLATQISDGAMSKEDKWFLDSLRELDIHNKYATKDEVQEIADSVEQIEQSYMWSEM